MARPDSPKPTVHRPVLVESCAAHIIGPRPGLCYIDCNLGDGGFTHAILSRDPTARILAFELDSTVIGPTLERLGPELAKQVTVYQRSFAALRETLASQHLLGTIAGVVVDPGLRLGQATDPSAGFSFSADGPLRMTFDPAAQYTAADYLKHVSVEELAARFIANGIAPKDAHRVAQVIVTRSQSAPLETTGELRDLIIATLGRTREGKRHVATRYFQAIRTAVTGELEAFESLLPQLLDALMVGGKAAILTYQGEESKIAREFLKTYKHRRANAPVGPRLRVLTPSPERPSLAEIRANPAARSALLRVIERIQ